MLLISTFIRGAPRPGLETRSLAPESKGGPKWTFKAGNGSSCACSTSCSTGYNTSAACAEGLRACASRVDRIEGIAVLEGNSVYRVGDVLGLNGARYRLDSTSILCEPRYRATLLRRVLVSTSTLNGRPTGELCKGLPAKARAPSRRSCSNSRASDPLPSRHACVTREAHAH